MVIRELLDCVDKEMKAHKDSIIRLEEVRVTILGSCREEKKRRKERKPCNDKEARKAA